MRDGRVAAFESLARWRSSDRGLVAPGEFIPVAEQLGAMSQIRARILERTCSAAVSWKATHPEVAVSVNLSPSELADPAFADTVARALFRAKLPAESLMLEITESDLMWDLDASQKQLTELRKLGVHLVLDDFGTGRSSLEQLDGLAFHAVKIAKPFVDRLLEPGSDASFMDTFVRLARSLQMQCAAKGIEHAAQVPLLLECGCTLGQGFHFTEPLREEELGAYLRERPQRGAG